MQEAPQRQMEGAKWERRDYGQPADQPTGPTDC